MIVTAGAGVAGCTGTAFAFGGYPGRGAHAPKVTSATTGQTIHRMPRRCRRSGQPSMWGRRRHLTLRDPTSAINLEASTTSSWPTLIVKSVGHLRRLTWAQLIHWGIRLKVWRTWLDWRQFVAVDVPAALIAIASSACSLAS